MCMSKRTYQEGGRIHEMNKMVGLRGSLKYPCLSNIMALIKESV